MSYCAPQHKSLAQVRRVFAERTDGRPEKKVGMDFIEERVYVCVVGLSAKSSANALGQSDHGHAGISGSGHRAAHRIVAAA